MDPEEKKENFPWLEGPQLLIVAAALMFVGIMISFYSIRWGGIFVGVSLGLTFSREVEGYFLVLRDFYSANGVFKTMMCIGGVLYFIMALPFFIGGVGLGYLGRYLMRNLS